MYNPLVLFTKPLLTTLLNSGYSIFVRQSYLPGIEPGDNNTKEAFLITPYMDIGEANLHFQAIRFDKRKYIYQAHRQEEMDKLFIAASQPPGYKVFAAWLKEEHWAPSEELGHKLKRYISIHTNWRPNHTVDVELFFKYGELFLSLRYGQEELKVPLHQIIAG
ncbi:hypothetical protein CLV59_101384 [Chitinophaga dinghuensis]|uniref:Uncharacterized protein n=1 Tax=Chitinophaga dinghuensis TaxID=1539050 RepID=A0A327WAL5_9BACT|nr:hypothetical protein [Chitinophaga dinghuensis]RAJ87623.1 hypothetical protein CLV59_101384 [Chitinophaga dinghuensis]